MTRAFFDLCEDLWAAWLRDELVPSPAIVKKFCLDSAPEPYLRFGHGARRLVVLTTNPGGSMPYQHRSALGHADSPLRDGMSYAEAATGLSEYYMKHLKGPARQRIAAMIDMAQLSRYDAVLQVEVCPFHSRSLPNKSSLVGMIAADSVLGNYVTVLEDALAAEPVLGISAVSTKVPLDVDAIRRSKWLQRLISLMRVHVDRARFIPLPPLGPRTTAAAFVDTSGEVPKVLVLMMGGNHLPAALGRRAIAEALLAR